MHNLFLLQTHLWVISSVAMVYKPTFFLDDSSLDSSPGHFGDAYIQSPPKHFILEKYFQAERIYAADRSNSEFRESKNV